MRRNHVTLPADDYQASVVFCRALGLTLTVAAGLVPDCAPREEAYLWRRAGFTDPAGSRIFLFHAGKNQHYPPWRVEDGTAPDDGAANDGTDGERQC